MGIAIDNCDERRCERYELGLGEHGVERYTFLETAHAWNYET